jgi:hypothetical protein
LQYERLSTIDLQGLEKQFIDYLVLRGVTSSDWESIKSSDIVKAHQHIDAFSDIVYEKVLTNVKALMRTEGDHLFLFVPQKEYIELNIFKYNAFSAYTNDIDTHNMVFVSASNKPLSHSRNKDLFLLLKAGCSICKNDVLDHLLQVKVASN